MLTVRFLNHDFAGNRRKKHDVDELRGCALLFNVQVSKPHGQ